VYGWNEIDLIGGVICMKHVSGQVIVVTGGASGMGRIMALRLAERGAKVAVFDLDETGLAGVAAQSDNIYTYRCDISKQRQVGEQVAAVNAALGPIDRLVHAAALMPSHALRDHDTAAVLRLMEVNFSGTVFIVKAILPQMLERDRGDIIVFGSVAGLAMLPKLGAYCASKAAVNVYIETLHYELVATGLNVHLVCPAAVNTPLLEQSLSTDTPGSLVEAKANGRLADPEKIIDAIERGVAKGRVVIYPGEARWLSLWHALMPRLWWRTMLYFEK
jgi:NAD(P)-dependent dehydrogenase (short-subunit alcohol dehydrogenase family)